MEIFTAAGFAAFLQVIAIDLVLAAATTRSSSVSQQRAFPLTSARKAILVGILAATVLRIAFAAITVQLLAIVGLQLLGGCPSSLVCWKMWSELRSAAHEANQSLDPNAQGEMRVRKTFLQAATQIVIADVSMSLDNVLAVAGAAQDHPSVLVIGLIFSIALMGLAANFIASLLHKHRWIAYVGLAVIFYGR